MACESCLTKILTAILFLLLKPILDWNSAGERTHVFNCCSKTTQCISHTIIKPSRAEELTWVFPSWRNFQDETCVFSKDSRPTAQARLLHSPKCSQAVSSARESTSYIVEQPPKPALNLGLWGNSEELAVCPGLRQALMSPHTHLCPKLGLTSCPPLEELVVMGSALAGSSQVLGWGLSISSCSYVLQGKEKVDFCQKGLAEVTKILFGANKSQWLCGITSRGVFAGYRTHTLPRYQYLPWADGAVAAQVKVPYRNHPCSWWCSIVC